MGDMYREICSWENLRFAHRRASRGKRGREAAAAFEYHLADNLLALQAELEDRTYRPGAYASFIIRDPKRRLISAAPFRDRVVHHALCAVTEPLFERSFSAASFANRVGKGTHRALARAQALARRFRYVLQFDVQQFFPAIDHRILRPTLARKLDDPDVLGLVDRILASGEGVLSGEYRVRRFPGDVPADAGRPRGLPIGNLTSQCWANCYLNPFDHFIQRELRCRGYVRYVDDGLVFADDKRSLWRWREAIVTRLARLRLTIHQGAHPRPCAEGFPFLGVRALPHPPAPETAQRGKFSPPAAARDRRLGNWRAETGGGPGIASGLDQPRPLRGHVGVAKKHHGPSAQFIRGCIVAAEPMTIFTRTYDFVSWLIPKTVAFPRHQRFVVTRRLQDAALNFQEYLIEANRQRGGPRLERLRQADAALDKVRLYLRLAVRWQWLSEAQYQHVSRMVKEIGDLLGGWIRQSVGTKGRPV